MGSEAVARHPEDDYHPGFCFKETEKQRGLAQGQGVGQLAGGAGGWIARGWGF